MAALNNITTADDFTSATTLLAPDSTRLRLFVNNAAVYRQIARGGRAGGLYWDDRDIVFTPPGTYSFDETASPFDAARVRSAAPGQPAQVTLEGAP